MEDVYQRLAKRLDEMPNGFPATTSGVELKILKKIFSPEEAEMFLKLSPIPQTVEAIAAQVDIPVSAMQAILDTMVLKGQIASTQMFGAQVYMSVPFVFGIYEFQLNRLDKELADLVEEYAPTFLKTLGKYAPAMARVVPINAKIDAKHVVYRYEDVRQIIEKSKAFQLTECICRKERAIQGHPCKHSTHVCLGLSGHEGAFDRYAQGRLISREEALDVIDKAEQEGLVHTTYNVQKGHIYICNCCSCCCGILRGMKRFNLPYLMATSNFVALIDEHLCSACGVCAEERCPMKAISAGEKGYHVQPERCIGCGVCTTTCPTEAITLIYKPPELQNHPPLNLLDWYVQRANTRGVKIKM